MRRQHLFAAGLVIVAERTRLLAVNQHTSEAIPLVVAVDEDARSLAFAVTPSARFCNTRRYVKKNMHIYFAILKNATP